MTRRSSIFAIVLGVGFNPTLHGATPTVAASNHTIFLSASGAIQTTGFNFHGQLGIGDKFSRSLFHPISIPPTVTQVAAGPEVTYVLKTDGTLWACGSGSFGLLGDSSFSSSSTTLKQVGVDTDWKQISLGEKYVIGIKQTGSLWSWGYSVSRSRNSFGFHDLKVTRSSVFSTFSWHINNGDTFTAIIRDVVANLNLEPHQSQIVRSLTGHIVAGVDSGEEDRAFRDFSSRLTTESLSRPPRLFRLPGGGELITGLAVGRDFLRSISLANEYPHANHPRFAFRFR